MYAHVHTRTHTVNKHMPLYLLHTHVEQPLRALSKLEEAHICATPAHDSCDTDSCRDRTCTFAHDLESQRRRATRCRGCDHL